MNPLYHTSFLKSIISVGVVLIENIKKFEMLK